MPPDMDLMKGELDDYAERVDIDWSNVTCLRLSEGGRSNPEYLKFCHDYIRCACYESWKTHSKVSKLSTYVTPMMEAFTRICVLLSCLMCLLTVIFAHCLGA